MFIRDLYCIEALRRLDTFPALESAHLSLQEVSANQADLITNYRSTMQLDAHIISILRQEITNERASAKDMLRKERIKAFGIGAGAGALVAAVLVLLIKK